MEIKLSRVVCFVIVIIAVNSGRSNPECKSFKTWKELREENVIMQRFDFSCGAAALATLMLYYFQDNVTEVDMLEDILRNHLEADIKDKGVSLFDLKRVAERKGYQAYCAKLKPSALPKLPCPILVYLQIEDYQHFAVFRGVREDQVFLADPMRGNIRMPIKKFIKEWKNGIGLILQKEGFEPPSTHPLSIDMESPLRHELQTIRRMLLTI